MGEVIEFGIIGIIVGIISGLLGVGGGSIIVPTLTLLGIKMQQAVPTSLLYILFTSASGALTHLRQGTAHPRLGLIILPPAMLSATLGTALCHTLPSKLLQVVFGTLFVIMFIFYLRYSRPKEDKLNLDRILRPGWGVPIGIAMGFEAGLLGIGGGLIVVSLMVIILRVSIKKAIGTSLFCIFWTAILSILVHRYFGFEAETSIIPLIIGGIVGARVGAKLAFRIDPRVLRTGFGTLLLGIALLMLCKGLDILL
jgi:hypothetical protein